MRYPRAHSPPRCCPLNLLLPDLYRKHQLQVSIVDSRWRSYTGLDLSPSSVLLPGWDQKDLGTSQRGKLRPVAHMAPDWHQTFPTWGKLKVWSEDREELGSDKQVVLRQSFKGLQVMYLTKVGWWRGMVGKHRAWRELLKHSHYLASAAAAPSGLQTQFYSATRNQKSIVM